MLVVVTGPDGAGKTTVCHNIQNFFAQNLNERSVTITSVWDNYEDLFLSHTHAQDYLKNLQGLSRSLFIFHAIQRALENAQAKNNNIIIMDSYWYKYAVSEIALGVPRDFLFHIAKTFPTPDLTLYLDISPEIACKRKKFISEYEKGKCLGKSSTEKFLRFQTQQKNLWKEIEFQFGPWFHISGEQSPEEILNNLLSIYLNEVA